MRVHVVGLGLIGSSIGLGLSRRGAEVSGEDLDEERARRALELGVVSSLTMPDEGELVGVVATPAKAVVRVARRFLERRPGRETVVTDVAGVKAPIAAALGDPRFVPGHPMAGSEQEGPDGADPDLFIGATWVLAPTATTSEAAFSKVAEAVALLGAEVVALPPERHDALVAVVSHVPHLTAATLMALAAESPVDHGALMRLAAGGFRDMTRIAAGSPSIWPDICEENAEAICGVLDLLGERLAAVRRLVARGDRTALAELLSAAQVARQNLPQQGARPSESVELRIVVLDRPGVLAELTALAADLGVNIYDIEIAHSVEGRRGVVVLSVDRELARRLAAALKERGQLVFEGTGSRS